MRRWLVVLLVLFPISASAFALLRVRVADHAATNSHSHLQLNQSRHNGLHAGHAAGAGVQLRLAVDGASNPTAISDDRAYEHFLRVLAAASPKLRYNLLRDVLEKPDQVAVMNVLDSSGSRLAGIAKQQSSPVGNSTRRLDETRAFEDLRTRIEDALSFDGRMKLNTHIRTRVKSRIKIYRDSTAAQESLQ